MLKRVGLKINFIMLFLSLSGCGWISDDINVQEFRTHINVAHLRNSDGGSTWNVKYHFSEPVNGIVFRRQRSHFRTNTWQPVNSLMKVAELNGHEVIHSSSGSVTEIEIKMIPHFSDAPRDYEFFVPFSDGSMAIYTGHFDIRPLFCPGMRVCNPNDLLEKSSPKVVADYTFTPAPGEQVLVTDTLSTESVSWKSEREGRYIYFGNIPIHEASHYRAIIDPKLPRWMQKKIAKAIPTLIDFYTVKTSFNLEAKPLVLFSYSELASFSGTRGGVLHQQVRLSAFGSQWHDSTDKNITDVMELVAHELAHLWNGDLFFPGNGDFEAWMHEGGADAFAYRALFELSVINKTEYLALQTQAVNRCVLGLYNSSLRSSDALKRYRNYYSCGAAIGLISDAAVGKTGNSGLFSFWSELFKTATTQGNAYTAQMYYSVLNNYGDGTAGSIIEQIVETQLSQPDYFINNALNKYGVETSILRETPPWYEAEAREYTNGNLFQFISIRKHNALTFSH